MKIKIKEIEKRKEVQYVVSQKYRLGPLLLYLDTIPVDLSFSRMLSV